MSDPPAWCVVANVVDLRPYGPGGAEHRRGLRIFRPGAKLYIVDGFGGMGWEVVRAVGQARRSSRFVCACVRAEHLTGWRVTLVYSPAALHRIAALRGGLDGFWLRGFGDPGSEAYRDALRGVADSFQE